MKKEYKISPKFKNVVEQSICAIPNGYNPDTDGYVYLITDLDRELKNKKLPKGKKLRCYYLGYHEGTLGFTNGEYFCSMTSKDGKKVLANKLSRLKYSVLHVGNGKEMKNLEHKMLKDVDAINNELYWNKSNGNPAYVEIDNKLILGLQQEVDIAIDKWVKDNSYLDLNFPVVKLSVDEVSDDWIRHQFRTEEFDKTIKSVKNTVIEKNGDTSTIRPVVGVELPDEVLFNPESQSYVDAGSILLTSGNHRTTGIVAADAVEMYGVVIPQKYLEGWTEVMLDDFSSYFNPIDTEPRVETTQEDAIQQLLRRNKIQGIPIDSENNREYLQNLKFSKDVIQTIISKAKTEQHTAATREVWIGWGSTGWSKTFGKVVDSVSNIPRTIGIRMSSSKFDLERISHAIKESETFDKKGNLVKNIDEVIVLVSHSHMDAKDYWDTTDFEGKSNMVDWAFKEKGYEVTFWEMPTTRGNIGITSENFFDNTRGKNWLREHKLKLI